MAETVWLHIGAMKSGTSFVQDTLDGNRDVLADQGFLFPGRKWRKQVLAVLDVLGQTRDGRVAQGQEGAWDRLVAEVDAFAGTALVSMEFLGPTPVADIEKVVSAFTTDDVRVVMTVRDLGRNIPAMWQEGLKNGVDWHWSQYLDEIRDGPSRKGRAKRFWRHMNYAFIARKWVGVVGPERFTLVTVPHPGAERRLLWDRFCGVVGLDPAPFDTGSRSNASLGAASAQLLRALNEALPDVPLARYQKVVKHDLARHHLAARAAQEDRIGYRADWVDAQAAQQRTRLAALGVPVVGDLAELEPVGGDGVDPEDVTAQAQLDAAVSALAHLVRVWPTP